LWQVYGSNKPDPEERMKLDNKYFEIKNWKTDLVIILKTIPSLFRFKSRDL
jgi:lipopolysaccharide/colanic/teichoic acid biosynthesis glycosyltransferase